MMVMQVHVNIQILFHLPSIIGLYIISMDSQFPDQNYYNWATELSTVHKHYPHTAL